MTLDEAKAAAEKIVQDLEEDITDRRGLKWEWQKIDAEVMAELKETWRQIICSRLVEEPHD